MEKNNYLSSILDLDKLKNIFKHFSITTNLSVKLVDCDGNALIGYHHGQCDICEQAKGCLKCKQSLKYGGEKSEDLGEPYIFRCGCGLIMCSSPIVFNEKLIGSIVCGPVILWEADEYAKEELKQKTIEMNIKVEVDTLLQNVCQLSCTNMTSSAQMLFIIADYMCREQSKHLSQREQISNQQSKIADLLIEKKQNAASIDVYEKSNNLGKYPEVYEKELISYVQMGDKTNATRILNILLGEIFSLAMSEIDTMKARLYELTAFLSRSAVEAGATLEAMTPLMKKSTQIFADDTNFEKLCLIVKDIMIGFMDAVYQHRETKQTSQHLSRAISYIRNNYANDLSLDTVADNVYVSAFYLSHLFRDEMDITFSDYVTNVRIEESKSLLKNTHMKIFDVASSCGFNDANYFTKTFKKITGISPKQYLKIFL